MKQSGCIYKLGPFNQTSEFALLAQVGQKGVIC